jgi:Raf kinase inhibitor-like YbhB/YbcL family protein
LEDIIMSIHIQSAAFQSGQPIPKKYTGEGPDVSPPLRWSGVPAQAKSLVLVVDDPDAPKAEPWVHWLLYDLPPSVKDLPEGVPAKANLDAPAARQGKTDFGRVGYGGPMPPKGHGVHHYHFKLYALDQALDLPPGIDKPKLLDAIGPHVIEEGELVGTYERK